jgi:hypothetical protein
MIAYDMAFVSGRMIQEFGYRGNIFEVKYRRIRTVYTIGNTGTITVSFSY